MPRLNLRPYWGIHAVNIRINIWPTTAWYGQQLWFSHLLIGFTLIGTSPSLMQPITQPPQLPSLSLTKLTQPHLQILCAPPHGYAPTSLCIPLSAYTLQGSVCLGTPKELKESEDCSDAKGAGIGMGAKDSGNGGGVGGGGVWTGNCIDSHKGQGDEGC
ncbi:hypothetical protein BS47DRAFT_1365403 [Hydnum rufescens UP504]|uniref:Uncharacterized protein n=1 Tax=Hydnum rufescens UP504 TaxID=1448309 RepID=A0A9P6ANT0_9AGAM|nr:hypothetical protein BS47DRAFT_1365403 [Hydnum rufescens UP504]